MIKVNLNNEEAYQVFKGSANDMYDENERDDILLNEEKDAEDIEMKSESDFPFNLSKTKNDDMSNYRPISFKNHVSIDENFTVEKLPFFDKIEEIEKNFEKKVKKSVKEFLNIEKNPLNVVPKKNNIDLKRNLTKKLEKLNKKTEIAIMEIIKENIEKQKKELEIEEEDRLDKEIHKKENFTGNKLLLATNMQMSIQEEALRKEYFNEENEDEEEDEISSDYDKGIIEI